MSKKSGVWDIKKTKSSLGPSVCTNILFVYFFLDVTRPPGSMALKKLTIDAYLFFQQAEAFNRSAATEEEIVLAGEKALLCVYNCKSPVESLDTLRCTRFCQQAATARNNLCTARKPSTNVGSCRVSQPESVLPNTVVERNTAQA